MNREGGGDGGGLSESREAIRKEGGLLKEK